MKITRRQLRHMINEEAERNLYEQTIPPAVAKKGAEVGLTILLAMLATASGRERLASILVAIPDFIKTYICNLPGGWIGGAEPGKRKALGTAYEMLCRFGVSASFWFLYTLAWFLRLLSDDEAKIIIGQAPAAGETEASPPDMNGTSAPASSPQSVDLDSLQVDIAQPGLAESFSAYDLKRLIKEELQKEAWFGLVTDPVEEAGKKFPDAKELFRSMKGLGTTEKQARAVIEKRRDDLHILYQEFNDFLMELHPKEDDKSAMTLAMTSKYNPAMGWSQADADSDRSQDLIEWLVGDGLGEEAEQVLAALNLMGIRQTKPGA